jgi:hypothetical protein
MEDVTENVTDPPRAPASRPPIRWWPDDSSLRILAAYARRKEKRGDVLRRALRMLAMADGVLDPRGRVRVEPRARRP